MFFKVKLLIWRYYKVHLSVVKHIVMNVYCFHEYYLFEIYSKSLFYSVFN